MRLPLIEPFVAAHGRETDREVVLVRVTGESGEAGWGECSALAEPTYTAEDVDSAWEVLTTTIGPAALAGGPAPVADAPMATAAMATAWVDLELRQEGLSLADSLGAERDRVESCLVVGISPSIDALLARIDQGRSDGYTHVKLKIRPGWDTEPARAVRDAWPEVSLAADANGSYSRDEGPALARLDDLGLAYIEQPLPADDLTGTAALAPHLDTAVALDESLSTVAAAAEAVSMIGDLVLNVKPARVGGLDEARRMHDLATDNGVSAFVGGMLETGVGRAAALGLAALDGFDRPTDLGPSTRYFHEDLTAPFTLGANGTLAVPTGPGIGVDPDLDRVADATVDHRELS